MVAEKELKRVAADGGVGSGGKGWHTLSSSELEERMFRRRLA